MGCSGSRPDDDVSLTRSPEAADVARFRGAHSDMANGVAAGVEPGSWLSCAEDKLVALTDWHEARVVQAWRGHERGVNRVIAAPQLGGGVGGAISASRDTTVRLWKRHDEAAVATLRSHELSVSAIALSADCQLLFSGSRDSSVKLWDVSSASDAASPVSSQQVSRNVVTCMRWVDGEPRLVAQGSEDLRLRLWDVRALREPAVTLEGYVYFPLCVDCAGPYVLTGSNGFDGVGCELRLWDVRTRKQVALLEGHAQGVAGCALLRSAADGAMLAASGSKDGEVRVWETTIAEGARPTATLADLGGVTGLAAAAAGEAGAQLYASSTTGEVHALRLDVDATHLSVAATAVCS